MAAPKKARPIALKRNRRATDQRGPKFDRKTKYAWSVSYRKKFPSLSEQTISQLAGLMASKNLSHGEGYISSIAKLRQVLPTLKTKEEQASANQLIQTLASRLAYEKQTFRRQHP